MLLKSLILSRYFRKFNVLICVNKKSTVNFSVEAKNNKDETHFFGYQEVSPTEKRDKVQTVFSNVAEKYDLMNDVMSAGIHRLWKDYFIHILSPTPGTKLLDVAGGTGDIAFRFLNSSTDLTRNITSESHPQSHVTVLDLNEKMLSVCRQKAEVTKLSSFLTCIQGNAEILPFPDNSFDVYTVAFGIRNVVHIDEALLEAHRVLKPGGRFLCLEFSKVNNSILERLHSLYTHEIIPVMGEIIAGDWRSYQYLAESIAKFPNQETFLNMVRNAGFSAATYENLLNGTAAIHCGYKL